MATECRPQTQSHQAACSCRPVAASLDRHMDTLVVKCPQHWSPRPTPPKLWRGPPEPPPPLEQFGSVGNIVSLYRSGSSNGRCPSPGILGSNSTTDPGGEPLPPDQSPFSVLRRSCDARGGIIMNPPPPPPESSLLAIPAA